MKITDLRIGNIVCGGSQVIEVRLQYIKVYDGFATWRSDKMVKEWLQPVPLDENWLAKFGFTYRKAGIGGQDQWSGMGFITNGKVDFRGIPQHLHLVGYFNTQIKYVHELQNLYFTLTGEELNLK